MAVSACPGPSPRREIPAQSRRAGKLKMDKWLILDRDGVINYDSDAFIKSPEEWRPLPGSLEAMAALTRAGYRIVVITNQSGLARGLFDRDTLEAIHARFRSQLGAQGGAIEHIYFCPHGPDDNCACRKPRPGMFEQFAQDYHVDLGNVYAVGDSIRDLQAAQAAGARSALVRTGKGIKSEQYLRQPGNETPLDDVPIYNDLGAFTRFLLA